MVIAAPSSARNEKLATYERFKRDPHQFKLIHFPSGAPITDLAVDPIRVYLADAEPFDIYDQLGAKIREIIDLIREGYIEKNDETRRKLEEARDLGNILRCAMHDAVMCAVAQGGFPITADRRIERPGPANDDAPASTAPKTSTRSGGATERSSRAPSPAECISQFQDAMDAAGLRMKGPLKADDGIVRFHVEGDPKGSHNGWYFLWTTDGWPNGQAGSWRAGSEEPIVRWVANGTDGKGPTAAERKAMKERQVELQRQREAEQAEAQRKAAEIAKAAWDAGTEAPADHPYLTRKHVNAFGLKVGTWVKEWVDENGEVHRKAIPNALLVPIRSPEQETKFPPVSLQAIFPSKALGRDKDFLTDGRLKGCWYSFGAPKQINGTAIDAVGETDAVVIVICEGYATGASIHMATGHLVVVAFHAGNLRPVAQHFREQFPNAIIVIAGDNDAWTEKPIKNPGATRAIEAANAVNGTAVMPRFTSLDDRPSDFNDLHVHEGLEMVERQVMGPVKAKIMAAAQSDPAEQPAQPAAEAKGTEQPAQPDPQPEAEATTEAETEQPKAAAGAATGA